MDQVSSQDDLQVDEQRLRNFVAICTRTLNHLGILGYSGHVSVQLPESNQFLIQAFDQSRAKVAPDDLIVVDAKGVPAKIIDSKMEADLAKTLANHNGALMRAHGAVIVAESIEARMIDAIHFVENAETMYKAAMLGPVKPLSHAEMQEIEAKTSRSKHISKLWDYYTGNAVAADVFPQDWL
tara:strand:+ start:2262 stop:2807 length:546 start_codon:yes stop_codon:yes gene_type:complete